MKLIPMNFRFWIVLAVVPLLSEHLHAQEFIPLWPQKILPNSKQLRLTDSVANERIYRVALPGVYAYFAGRQENKGAAVIICPGGSYERLAYIISGVQLAKWLNTMGINAFVLNYRLPNSPDLKEREIGPLMDAQRAMKLIRANATAWAIDVKKVGIMGTSSGGHLAATAGTCSIDVSTVGDSLDQQNFSPNFMILVSPVIDLSTAIAHPGSVKNLLGVNPSKELKEKFSAQLHVSASTPPCFIVGAINDKAVSPMNSLVFYQALLKNNVPVSFHVFPQGSHSIALRNNPGSTNLWTQLCEAWLNEMKIIEDIKPNKK